MNEISVDETVKWIEENCAEVSNFRFKTRLKTATPEKLRLKTAAPKFFSIFNTQQTKTFINYIRNENNSHLNCSVSVLRHNCRAQNVQGYVNDKNSGLGLENTLVKATSANDTTKHKETTTDGSGFYLVNDIITGLNNISGFVDEKMIITNEGNRMRINIDSKQNIGNGTLYSSDGKALKIIHFNKVAMNKFEVIINIQGIADQVLLFGDGVHPEAKIITGKLPAFGTQRTDFSEIKTKSVSTEDNLIKFELDDDASIDNYQPLEVVKTVNMENINYFDFEMKEWYQKINNTL